MTVDVKITNFKKFLVLVFLINALIIPTSVFASSGSSSSSSSGILQIFSKIFGKDTASDTTYNNNKDTEFTTNSWLICQCPYRESYEIWKDYYSGGTWGDVEDWFKGKQKTEHNAW